MTRFLICSLLICLCNASFAQNRQEGEAIIQLQSGISIEAFVESMNKELGILAQVTSKESIYTRMNLWLVGFNEQEVSMRDFLYNAKKHPDAVNAQANHIISTRLIPDDPFFEQQWHHQQTNDHDIDSELAWDITTGGTTPSGDEIVVCVVELGGAQ
ncbi:MAG: hypothetical protein ACKO7B_13120 [Flavobacteriales bacterium]